MRKLLIKIISALLEGERGKITTAVLEQPEKSLFFYQATCTLRPQMRINLDKWACTIRGEQRMVCCQRVTSIAASIEEAMKIYSIDEIIGLEIELVDKRF